jgi:AraC-like DNA-binding protein
MLPTAEVSMQGAARTLGYAPRTLQRSLSRLGASFDSIVEDRRRTLSTELLTDSTLSVGDVAMALGYSDSPHFIRAFHRWHGKSPTDFRRTLPQSDA